MSETAVRWSGVVLIAGAVLLGAAIVSVSLNPVVTQIISPLVSKPFLIASILLLLSLPGMYARQADASGWLGLAGYALLQAGIVLTLGLLLTGLATARAGIYPLWAGILLLATTAGFFFVFFVAEFLPPRAGQVGSAIFGRCWRSDWPGSGFPSG